MKATTTTTKFKKASPAKKSEKISKVKDIKYSPTEEEIREKAEEIYFQRIERGEHRNPEEDWYEAETLLGYSGQ